MLRLLHALCLLYPAVLRIKPRSRLCFAITASHPTYAHMMAALRALAFPEEEQKQTNAGRIPTIRTPLWPHQAQTAERVAAGVREGKRGFADASSVGAGKTLSALAAFVRLVEERGGHGHGCLVLVPQITLLDQWAAEAARHTSGLRIVTQASDGQLSSSLEGEEAVVVVTTLGRARDHPFTRVWTLVVVDECTSVQNDSALQTAEAWRQAAISTCGVLLLSATFFRARFSNLFYLIRLLQTALPRTLPYLNTILSEHVICHVPENRRTWDIQYVRVPLPAQVRRTYDALLSRRGDLDGKAVYASLKALLHSSYDPADAMRREVARLGAAGRRVLMFANTLRELALVGDLAKPHKLVTVHEAAYGLNFQRECDAIITRPHPGDLLEQMKGRIDRPGQEQQTLLLVVVLAEDTVEEAEVANIHLCGRFVSQYLHPLSEQFQSAALHGAKARDLIQPAPDEAAAPPPPPAVSVKRSRAPPPEGPNKKHKKAQPPTRQRKRKATTAV